MNQYFQSVREISLNNCDREPIHIPGSIQAHGFLLNVDDTTFKIKRASVNVTDFLELELPEILDQDIINLICPDDRPLLLQVLGSSEVSSENPLNLSFLTARGLKKFDCVVSQYKGELILEFEPSSRQSELEFKSFYHLATRSVEKLRAAQSLIGVQQSTVDEVRRITGFDRVVIYKFNDSWNGHVSAESKSEAAQSYLDLHFPASDVPAQVRDLYLINPLRNIPTVDYTPSTIASANVNDDAPLDLSLTSLRNVSAIHLEYLHNMDVTASMSASILKNGKLWGLISCSHESGPNFVSYEKRAVCTFLASTLSSLLPYFEDQEDVQLRSRLHKIQNSLVVRMTESDKFIDGLFNKPNELLALTNSTGVAAYFDGEWRIAGQTPRQEDLNKIRTMISENESSHGFATSHLRSFIDSSSSFSALASGVLGFSISKSKTNYILWFRPEVIQTVKWGGNPNKPVELKNDRQVLHPRKSFELWKETVRQKSLPWKPEEIEAARNLRFSITDIVLQRIEQVTKLNSELERSNVELDSFAYAASHDLKEPLRGISNYTAMVLRDETSALQPKNKERMETVLRLTQRAESLINSLLDYSQLGRSDLVLETVSLGEIVATALDTLRNMLDETKTKVIVNALPIVRADRTQLNEVFTNLIVNAVKYNSSEQKEVVIGTREEASDFPMSVISVRDNGIGIAPAFHGAIFKIFKRLHSKGDFGGGSGTGLTIVKKIVERHGGTISVESDLGQGTNFLIFLPKANE